MRMLRAVAVLLLSAALVMSAPAQQAETPEAVLQKAKAVLAQLDGAIKLPGIKEPVEVLRDRWGVPHIYAKNTDDLFFAQGFVVAQDRLFQIDLWRRIAIGETSEVLGKKGLEADRFARLVKYRGDMQAEWTSYAPDTQQIATAFTRGINAAIDHKGERLPIEFQILGYKPAKWQPEDILGRMSGIIMTRNFRDEVLRAELVAAVGVEKARRIAPTNPVREYGPAAGLDLAGIDRSILAGYDAATRVLPFALRGKGDEGSNNWAIDGNLSASGKPMMASDPHRPINLPSLRYLAHLNAPGWNVIGAGEPALPGIALGHNERVAWGFTIVGTDQADLFVEETKPGEPTQYKIGEKWEAMKVVKEKVTIKGAPAVELELRFTRHGPVIHEDAKRNRAFALRWAGSEPGGAAYLPSLALDRVQSARDFVAALSRWKLPSLNMVHADVDGNIGWVAAAATPIRDRWDGLLPAPGKDHDWQGFRELRHLPQEHNPARGYIVTANHNILPLAYPHEIAYEWAVPFRYLRLKERLDAKKQFTIDDSKHMQHDNVSIAGRRLARLAQSMTARDPALEPYIFALREWHGDLSVDSRPGVLYGFWLQEMLDAFFRPHVPPNLLEFARGRHGIEVMLTALEKPDEFWFGKDPPAGAQLFLRSTLAAAIPRIKKALGPNEKEWTWGKLHTTTLRHPLAQLGPVYEKAFNLGPVPKAGDGFTPHAAAHNAKFEQLTGASYRHIFDLADWDKGVATSVPGQSGQPGSAHYGDLLPLWAEGQYFPLAYSRKKVEEVTVHRLMLQPAAK
ncbi:hypothetical protein AYO44_07240 [Planctomycetaceae bacterium SCGC AG-212-F19]|nr:hypothetical protein AYO44_07240 [Planctomycetaceae bacterium SCGC AG-212-F19]